MIPSIRTRDVPAAVDFYTEKLGFDVLRSNEGNVAVGIAGVRLMLEASTDFYSPAYNDAIRARLDSPSPHALYIEMSNLEEYYEQLRAAGVEIVDPLEPRPWGQTEFTVADGDGNWLSFWRAT
jgi:catechol 2,3-dioxygenase-like lactoylglutathione lyase family enzyme